MTDETRPPLAWVAPFLDALSAGETVKAAAKSAPVDKSTAYAHRRRNAEFDAAWRDAVSQGRRRNPRTAPPGQNWRRGFLEALAETSNVTAAAKRMNVPTATVYKERREQPEFRAQWHQALREGYEHLELETLHRLRMGTAGRQKFDIANALRLLALHKDSVARERARQEEEDEDAILIALDAKVRAMRAHEREAARLLAATPGADAFG